MNFGSQTKLEVQGKARHEAARRRNSECKINLSSRNSLAAMAVSRPTAQRLLAAGAAHRSLRRAASQSPFRSAVGLLPLPREEFRLPKLILHSELRCRAASRRALPCPSSNQL